jgi:hypothetical protein
VWRLGGPEACGVCPSCAAVPTAVSTCDILYAVVASLLHSPGVLGGSSFLEDPLERDGPIRGSGEGQSVPANARAAKSATKLSKIRIRHSLACFQALQCLCGSAVQRARPIKSVGPKGNRAIKGCLSTLISPYFRTHSLTRTQAVVANAFPALCCRAGDHPRQTPTKVSQQRQQQRSSRLTDALVVSSATEDRQELPPPFFVWFGSDPPSGFNSSAHNSPEKLRKPSS